MKIQTRLSLFSSMVFGIAFAITSLLIYALYYHNTIKSINENLKKTAYITAIFYLEEDELNKEDFSKAKEQFADFVSNTYYQVYNDRNQVSYGSQSLQIDPKTLDEIRQKKRLSFSENNFYCYGIFYEDNQGDFVIITKEKKEILSQQLNLLLWILVGAFMLGCIAVVFLSRWMADVAYRPFRKAIKQVQTISTHNLDRQIELPGTGDELQDLIVTFNDLLRRISETFVIQKKFVNYVSHEFKTPLTTLLGNLEVFSIKDRTPAEYKRLTQTLIQQINQLEETLQALMIVSDLKNNSDVTSLVRIDEIIWEIISKIGQQYNNSSIIFNINVLPADEKLLDISKDRTQLLIALFNLIENAVKYAQGKPVHIEIYNREEHLFLSITDQGIGIPTEQLANVNKPFYRADNTGDIHGNGIGLSIALRILEKNSIEYHIESVEGKGTKIVLLFSVRNPGHR